MTASVEHTDRLDAKIQTSTSYNKHATSLTPIKQYTFYNMSNRVIGECFIFGFVFKTNPNAGDREKFYSDDGSCNHNDGSNRRHTCTGLDS